MASLDLLGLPVSYLVLILIAAGARFMLTKEPPTPKLLCGSVLWGLLVVLGGYELLVSIATSEETGKLNKGIVTAGVALGSFFAKDLLEILIKLLEQVRVDPLALLRDLLNKYKPGNGGDNQ